jgi:DNA-directed RNA polymerase specialized sigma24 family protein
MSETLLDEIRATKPAAPTDLRELSAGEREVIALRVVLELDGDEAGRLLGLSATAVSTRLHRALGKLEERMKSHDV